MKQGPKSNRPPPWISGYRVPALCLEIKLISIHRVIRPVFSKTLKSLLGLTYPPEQTSMMSLTRERQKEKRKRNLDDEKQWKRHKQQIKKADSVSQDAPLLAWLMNGNRCVWLCGGSWRFWPMWHVYCLGDLGQWSTSGTSHNRVHTSTALRHPTRRVGRERERQGQGNIWVLSFSVTHIHSHLGFCAFWGCLDSSRCIWTRIEKNRSVCLRRGGGTFDWQPWTRMFPVLVE